MLNLQGLSSTVQLRERSDDWRGWPDYQKRQLLLRLERLARDQRLRDELRRAASARESLLHFATYTYPQYLAEPAHALISRCLERVMNGEIARLMIFAPPQHGKTELVSVRFPAFWLAHRPDDPIILCSYGGSLAHTKSREARAVVESPAYQTLFPWIQTDRTSRARDHWELNGYRGMMHAAGVGGPITGHGAALGIIDDPVENWEQARSQVYRDKTWDWWRTTFRTRIWDGGAIVLIMTRWHEDDLAGRILKDQGGEWTILRLPALAETQSDRDDEDRLLGLPPGAGDPLDRDPGAALCPARFGEKALEEIKRDVGPIAWAGQYQGVPRAVEGNRFKRDWFQIVDAVPPGAHRVRYWDKAGTQGGGKRTAGVLMALAGETYYVEHVVKGQWSAYRREKVIRQTAQLDAQRYGNSVRIWIEQEPGSGGKESAENTVRGLAGFPVRADRVTGDKDLRLEPFAAQCEAGSVHLLRGAWNLDFIEEMCAVPNGTFRDQADAAGGAFNKLAEAGRVAVRGPIR
jgi:predicted phage terminase large subunit-like protein